MSAVADAWRTQTFLFGRRVIWSPGNAPLTDVGKEYPEIYSLLQVCGE